jgi:hypothetical protein
LRYYLMVSDEAPLQFIQLALLLSGPESASDHASLAAENLDWEGLFRVADETRTMPLLIEALRVCFPALYRSPQLRAARDEFSLFRQRGEKLLAFVWDTLSSLEDAGIHALSFKGPFVAQIAYRNHLARQFHDIDIFVPPREYEQCLARLQDMSYRVVEVGPWETLLAADLPDCTILLDVHRRWMPPHLPEPKSTSAFWDRAQRVDLNGRKFLTLSDQDSMLISSLYFVKEWHNRGPCLRYAIDIAMLLHRLPEKDWALWLGLAKGYGIDRAFRIATTAALHLLGKDPAFLWEDVTDRRLAALGRQLFDPGEIRRVVVADKHLHAYSRHALKVRRAMWGADPLWLTAEVKSAGLRLFFVMEEDRQWLPLPESLHLLYFAIRPVRLSVQIVGSLLRGARG